MDLTLYSPEELQELMDSLPAQERKEAQRLIALLTPAWEPLDGPQRMAYESEADIIGYGGAAGGGKTDLICGMALTKHQRSLIVRREKAQTEGIIQRITEIRGNTDGFNGQKAIWKLSDTQLVEFAGLDNPGDERRWQGRPHSLKCVAKGTLVWMADGTRLAIEDIREGDVVDTLEGARKVTRTMQSERPAVRITTNTGETQVQGRTHELLTPRGWLSHAVSPRRRICRLRQDDAELQNPIYLLEDVNPRTPTHIPRTWSYAHPYTKEKRQTDRPVRIVSSRVEELGVQTLYDLTVDGSNHYMTGAGFVNRNCFDEVTEQREAQVRFVMGWLRSPDPNEKCKVLMTFNPPTTTEGRWVLDYYAPWLTKNHPNPAKPGELRWFTTEDGKDVEVPDNRPYVLYKGKREYDFDPLEFRAEDIIIPKSRTFIPARVTDNPYYMASGYMSTLQALPEPLRSQMLNGDFLAGIEDSMWQLLPTRWVEAAQTRWKDRYPKPPMDSLGLDVARGGKDQTVFVARHNMWFDKPIKIQGKDTPDGPDVAGRAVAVARDGAPIHIDVIGVGASPYDFLSQAKQHVVAVDVRKSATAKDMSGALDFFNLRSQIGWGFREALDPANNTGIEIPPGDDILRELCSINWSVSGRTIKVESREEIIKRLGYSPDVASAFFLANINTPKLHEYLPPVKKVAERNGYDPYANLEAVSRGEYDPYKNM